MCLLILGGIGQLYAHADRASVHDSSKLYEKLEPASADAWQNNLPSIKKSGVSHREETSKIDATEVREEEEDELELISSQRYRASGIYFAAVFCALTRCYFSSCIQEVFPFCRHFTDTSSYRRHLILQVFRI